MGQFRDWIRRASSRTRPSRGTAGAPAGAPRRAPLLSTASPGPEASLSTWQPTRSGLRGHDRRGGRAGFPGPVAAAQVSTVDEGTPVGGCEDYLINRRL
jgi:hypothetical protein